MEFVEGRPHVGPLGITLSAVAAAEFVRGAARADAVALGADRHDAALLVDGVGDRAWYGGPINPYQGADITRAVDGLDLQAVLAYARD